MLQALVQPTSTKKNSTPSNKSSTRLHLAPVCVGPYRIVALPKGDVQITFAHAGQNRSLTILKNGCKIEKAPYGNLDLADVEALFSALRASELPERSRHSVYAYLKYQASALAPESLAQWCMYVANDQGKMNIEDLKDCAQSLGRYDTMAQTWLTHLVNSFYTKSQNS